MVPIKVMVNGLPGKVAGIVAKHFLGDSRFSLLLYSLTGPEINETHYQLDNISVELVKPEKRFEALRYLKENESFFITVDYTHPSSVNDNANFYCKMNLPFVMGTTGGDRKKLEDSVKSSQISAVIAPNMAKQIVGFQAMIEWASDTFPGLFEGYTLEIKESHQKGKADTSGTAKAMVKYFNKFGIPFSDSDIILERDPENQRKVLNIPEKYLTGHAWHTYTLDSSDKTAKFSFSHNINGRDIYALGTLDAVFFLAKKVDEGSKGRVFSMIDVLKKN